MVIESPLEVQRVEGKECRDDPDTAEKKQKMVDDRLYVLRKAATRNPEGFRLSLHDRFFFMESGYTIRLNVDKSNNYRRQVKLVQFNPTGYLNETRQDLRYSQHYPMNNNQPHFNNYSRPDWKCFGGNGDFK